MSDNEEIHVCVDEIGDITTAKCSVCPSQIVEYKNYPCGCNVFCKKCAMKMATGGKCKTCHELFVSMKTLMK